MAFPAWGAIDVHQFDTEAQRSRFIVLTDELRCPKCQNQNLRGSNSQIATDLRRELYRLLKEGKSDREIKTFMVERYGDFVLYRPPVKSSTLFLWFFPIAMMLIGAIVLGLIIRQRRKTGVSSHPLSSSEQEKLTSLIQQNSEK